MITPAEEQYIRDHAYLPEHIVGYGTAISGGESFLLEDHLCYVPPGVLIFIGYPLKEDFDAGKMDRVLGKAMKRFQPDRVALIAPAITQRTGERQPPDSYYRLDLQNLRIPSKVKNMVRRASRELSVEITRDFTPEHRKLVTLFQGSHTLDPGTGRIFEKIPEYLAALPTARIVNARDGSGTLSAFDIADFWPKQYGIYMFNFRTPQKPVPGASDLLLRALIEHARKGGKTYLNLGLGWNEGVVFFKKKWGGEPFLRYEACVFQPSRPGLFRSLFFRQ